jgi:hypothetical protein
MVANSLSPCIAGGRPLEDREVSIRRKSRTPQVPNTELIDLLLDADESTRKVILFQALQTGQLKKSEADALIAQVARLERAASPRPTTPESAARAA